VFVLQLEDESLSFVTVSHSVISLAMSVVVIITQSSTDDPLSLHTTQLDHPATSVFAINTNHHFGAQFLVVTMYLYCQAVHLSHSHETSFQSRGSLGVPFIPACLSSFSIFDTSIQAVAHEESESDESLQSVPGRLPKSH
jgi:hypothetical protein